MPICLSCGQLQELLDAVDSVLGACSAELRTKLQERQQELVERWEKLRLHLDKREEQLNHARQRYQFLNTVRAIVLHTPLNTQTHTHTHPSTHTHT